MYVHPSLRSQGIGRLLLKNLLLQLNERKCEYIATLIPLGSGSAATLYESEGFSRGEQFLWLDKPLGSSFNRTGA
jgi:GNAT superfamily N-acetyltransferase